MERTGVEGSDDTVPDEVFQRSSSAVAGAQEEEEEEQYAQAPPEGRQEVTQQFLDSQETVRSRPRPSDDESDEINSDDDFDDEERENRFDGPASTWRFYTEAERGLAASLEQEEANDLSVHLHNAHALKARVRTSDAAASAEHHRAKKRWIEADDDGTPRWHPEASWTAWPLKPEDVPRHGEGFGAALPSREDDKATHRKAESWKPSVDLEDEIQAMMKREMKEQSREHERGRQQKMAALRASHQVTKQVSPRKRRRSSSSGSSEDSSDSNPDGTVAQTSPENRDETSMLDDSDDPDVLLDDDEAAKVLQSSVHNILSQLDSLLLGLHKSRQGHAKAPTSERSRSKYERRKLRETQKRDAAGDGKDPALGHEADGNRRSASRPTSGASSLSDGSATDSSEPGRPAGDAKPHRRRSKTSKVMGEAARTLHLADADGESPNPTSTGGMAGRKPRLNPRDWSEVLGVAALTGWDPAVVQRAADRCSALFGDSMTFSTFDHPSRNERRSNLENVLENDEVQGFSCPVESCPRHTEPWPLNKTWRWREHMKRSHKYSKGDIEALEAELKGNGEEVMMSGALQQEGSSEAENDG